MTAAQHEELWERYQAGETVAVIARKLGRPHATVNDRIRQHGGIRPPARRRAAAHLVLDEREEISRGLAAGDSLRAIAARLGRPASTVSREVARNGGATGYRAARADQAALGRARRPKPSKLARCARARTMVEAKLAEAWSPQQIAGWLARSFPDDVELQVSHETIYRSLFVQSKGALKQQLAAQLRTRRAVRRPGGNRARGSGQGHLAARATWRGSCRSRSARPRPPTARCPATGKVI